MGMGGDAHTASWFPLNSHLIVLFIPGEAKREVFESVSSKSLFDAPVQALLQAGEKLHVFASPKS